MLDGFYLFDEMKNMALQYELFYAVGESQEANLPQIREDIKKLVETQGGTWLSGESVERRKLAYPIKKETRAVYIAERFTVTITDERAKKDKAASITELSRQLELYKGVLRHIIVRAEGLPALGERETVPQIPRPGRRDDRRGDRRPDANQAREAAVDARLARKPESLPTVSIPTEAEEGIMKVEEKKSIVREEVETTKEKKAPQKKSVKSEKKVKEETESVVTEGTPKKKTTRKKKEVTLDEAEIDKKLDEVLNL